MRIRRLELRAFGPFTDRTLELDLGPCPGLHLVHGRNEAGKSSALRALDALLYGFPHQTGDDHQHAAGALRVGALLSNDGHELHVVRRKGRQRTLLDADEQPLPDDGLAPILAGIERNTFRRLCAFDSDELQRGSRQLLESGGGLAEGLLREGGLHELPAVLEALRDSARQRFLARGKNARLLEASDRIEERREQARGQLLGTARWTSLREQWQRGRARVEVLHEQRRALEAEREDCEQQRRLAELLEQRDRVQHERELLQRSALLDRDQAERRREATLDRDRDRQRREQLRAEIAELGDEAAAISVDERVLGAADAIQRLGRELARERDRRERIRELEERRQRLGGELRALRDKVGEDGIPGETDRAELGRLRDLAEEGARLQARREAADEALRDLRSGAGSVAEPVPGPEIAGDELRAILAAVDRDPDPEQALERALEQRDRVRREWSEAHARLAPWLGEDGSVPAGAAPSEEQLDRIEQAQLQLEAEERAAAEREAELARRRETLGRELRQLGADPEGELDAVESARAARDEEWRRGAAPADLEAWRRAFERRQREADEAADRRLEHSAHWHEARRLQRAWQQLRHERREARRQRRALARRRRDHEAEWASLWPTLPAPPGSPRRMRWWADRREEVQRLHSELRAREEACTAALERRDAVRRELRAALGLDDTQPRRLPALLEQAREVLRDHDTRVALIAREAEHARRFEVERRRRVLARRAVRREWEHWRARWQHRLLRHWLPPETPAAAALELLEDRRALLAARRAEDRCLRELERERAAAELFDRALERGLPELPATAALDALDRLEAAVEALARARQAARDRGVLQVQIDERERELQQRRQAADSAEQILRGLAEACGLASIDELAEAEDRGRRLRQLQRDEAELDRALDRADGGERSERREQARQLPPAEWQRRRDELDAERERLLQERSELEQELGHLRRQREELETQVGSIRPTQALHEEVARAGEELHEYLLERAGALFLEAQLRREQNRLQAPILKHASEALRAMTSEEYRGVRPRIDADDRSVLVCVRADGAEVPVEGLSRGTRDLLHLALRLGAHRSRFPDEDPPPLVFDDVLVHFDDQRALATLRYLGQWSVRGQVLLFTHHARLCELALRGVPAEQLRFHELERPAARAASAGGGAAGP